MTVAFRTFIAHTPHSFRSLSPFALPCFSTTILRSLPNYKMANYPQRLFTTLQKNEERQYSAQATEALVNALLSNNLTQVKIALQKGANPNHRINTCYFALHQAISTGDLEIVCALLKAGADVNICDPAWNVTPLHKAAFEGNALIVHELVQRKANVHVRSVHCGLLPLEEAVLSKNFGCCHVLLNAETIYQIHMINPQRGVTPCELAYQSGNENIIELFRTTDPALPLSEVPPSSEQPLPRTTPLHEAAAWGLVDKVQQLLTQGFNPKARNNRYLTASDVAQLQLIAHRVDPRLPPKVTKEIIQGLERTISILEIA